MPAIFLFSVYFISFFLYSQFLPFAKNVVFVQHFNSLIFSFIYFWVIFILVALGIAINILTSNNLVQVNFFFSCGIFFKSLLNLLQYCFCFMCWFFGHEACGILAPWPGNELAPPALEGEVLTTGWPGKSQYRLFQYRNFAPT